jgi:thiosulfate/3-mercaptopyruvate sulfurtransferase
MVQDYAFPEYLVDTAWVEEHSKDPDVRIVESDEDVLLYETGHIPGAVKVDWFTTLQHPIRRDFITKEDFEKLCRDLGISQDTTVVFYGDKSNWFATYAFWLFRYYGHERLRIMNGGRIKWEQENRPLTKDFPSLSKTSYQAREPDLKIRAFRDDVFSQINAGKPLVDVRSPKEYSGELIHMPNYPQEGATRGGHIPGAQNIPWAQATNESDSTFKSAQELRQLYQTRGITPDRDIIAYCRIGERSSHTWFVLKYLLGYPQVKNYDGSWTEWASRSAPIEKDLRRGALWRFPWDIPSLRSSLKLRLVKAEKLELLLQYATEMPFKSGLSQGNTGVTQRVEECMTPVFLQAELRDNRLHFLIDVPESSPTVRGFATILLNGLDGLTPEEILKVPNDFTWI